MLFGFMILDAIGKVVFIIGLLLLVIGFPYYLYKFLGLKMLRRRLARLAG